MRRPLVMYDFAPYWISLSVRKILCSFLSVYNMRFAQMVVDVLTEERDGLQKERDGEEGRFARLVTSLVETLHIDLGDFNGRWWSSRIRTESCNPRSWPFFRTIYYVPIPLSSYTVKKGLPYSRRSGRLKR
jgi:hypothetical protein